MEYEIYIDVAVATSFAMDLLALFLADVWLDKRVHFMRLTGVSLLGSLLGILLFLFLANYTVYTLLVHLVINPGMIYLAFHERNILSFVKAWGITYLTIFFAGGIMQWIYQTVFDGQYRMAAMLLTVIPGIFGVAAFRWCYKKKQYKVRVILACKGQSLELNAYYDTGNRLVDPYTRLPVSIVSQQTAARLWGENMPKARLIPYQSVGKTDGLLEAYTIDKMLLYRGKNEQTVEPAVIGLAKEALFAKGEYQMILNSQL